MEPDLTIRHRANDSTQPKSSASAQLDVTDATTQATALSRNQPRRLRELRKKSSRHEVGDVQPTTHDHIGSKESLHGNAQKTSRRSKDGWSLRLLTHALQPFLPCNEYIKLYADNDQPRVVSLLNYCKLYSLIICTISPLTTRGCRVCRSQLRVAPLGNNVGIR